MRLLPRFILPWQARLAIIVRLRRNIRVRIRARIPARIRARIRGKPPVSALLPASPFLRTAPGLAPGAAGRRLRRIREWAVAAVAATTALAALAVSQRWFDPHGWFRPVYAVHDNLVLPALGVLWTAAFPWGFVYVIPGTTALALSVGLALLVGFYILFTGRRLPQRPEDNHEGEIADGSGEIGFFSPHSWWPFWLGLAGAFTFLGVAIGWWMVLIGMVAVLLTTIGFVFEYYRGHFSH